jgi:hypothetical protein
VALTTHPLSSVEVKERVELYLYCPSGSSWPVMGELYVFFMAFKHRGVEFLTPWILKFSVV